MIQSWNVNHKLPISPPCRCRSTKNTVLTNVFPGQSWTNFMFSKTYLNKGTRVELHCAQRARSTSSRFILSNCIRIGTIFRNVAMKWPAAKNLASLSHCMNPLAQKKVKTAGAEDLSEISRSQSGQVSKYRPPWQQKEYLFIKLDSRPLVFDWVWQELISGLSKNDINPRQNQIRLSRMGSTSEKLF